MPEPISEPELPMLYWLGLGTLLVFFVVFTFGRVKRTDIERPNGYNTQRSYHSQAAADPLLANGYIREDKRTAIEAQQASCVRFSYTCKHYRDCLS
mmetsp:Transcript_961/g.1143  ORF Transcript_961/g.1143 Transcript_961/m.1143 type:complete len:96 (+) Transcript_961:160-447(+)